MTIKRLKTKLTPKEYFKRVTAQKRHINTAVSAIEKLNAQYADEHCRIKAGAVLPLSSEAKEGYDKFRVEKVVPVIEELAIDEKDGKEYEIGFKCEGTFLSETKEPIKGTIKLGYKDESDKEENKV